MDKSSSLKRKADEPAEAEFGFDSDGAEDEFGYDMAMDKSANQGKMKQWLYYNAQLTRA